ncbi:MAG: TolC family protein, partial [Bdellovibrionales bacterium]|nr:TolC family protein [Bdellovibrionales bacterium]
GTISQKIRFPVKYFLQAKAQKSRAASSKAQIETEKLNVRQKILSLYFSIYSTQKILELTKANMQTVKEFARVAEKKYAAGKSPQGDSMKAHFELTQLELDLLRLHQEDEALQAELNAIVNSNKLIRLDFLNITLSTPKFNASAIPDSMDQLFSTLKESSPQIQSKTHLLKEAEYKSTLAQWEFAPDIQLQYQQRISGEPIDSKIYSVALSFPLWFWRKSAEASVATSQKITQKITQNYRLIDALQKTSAKVKDLKGKVETGVKTLKIYETSLIPQAQGAYNSTRASYSANKTSFLDLLDSERSLYKVKTGFFQTLRLYVMQLSQLEVETGQIISDIKDYNGVKK